MGNLRSRSGKGHTIKSGALLSKALVLVAACCFSSYSAAHAIPSAGPANGGQRLAALPDNSLKALPISARQKIKAHMEAVRYAVHPVTASAHHGIAGHRAANPAMGYGVTFAADQVSFQSIHPGAPAWAFSMQLKAYGYQQGRLQPVQPARIRLENNRISYIRADLEEWYINTPKGIEQGFTLIKPPGHPGRKPLLLQLAVGGDLQPRMAGDGRNIMFYNNQGKRVLTYSKLKVIDALGKHLPARMSVAANSDQASDRGILIAVNDAQATYPVVVDPVLEAPKLTADDGVADGRFGHSIAVSGNTVAVGAYYDDGGSLSGAVYIFDRDQGGTDNWGQVAKLSDPHLFYPDYFGREVALDGDTLVVGAGIPFNVGSYVGALYIFERDQGGANNWGQVARLSPTDATDFIYYGYGVAISGDTVVTGAICEFDDGLVHDAVFVFERDRGGDDNWGQAAKLIPADLVGRNSFGWGSSLSGDTVAVASFGPGNVGTDDAVYIFERDRGGADNWGQAARIDADTWTTIDNFAGLELSGDTLAVSAYLYDAGGIDSGTVFVLERNQGRADNWGQVAERTMDHPPAAHGFGIALALSGDTLAMGTYYDDDMGDEAGAIHVFQRNQGGSDNWGLTAKFTAADGAAGDRFGGGVAASGDTVAVCATGDDDNGENSGSVYILDGMPGVTVTPTSGLTTSEEGDSATFTVVLDTNPYADVTIDLACSDTGEGSISTTSLTFTRTNWNVAQTVTVTGVDDDEDDDDQTYTVSLSAASSTGVYNGVDPDDVTLTNADDEKSGGGGGCFISAIAK